MIKELTKTDLTIHEMKLIEELCQDENIKKQVIEHIESALEEDFTPSLRGIMMDLIQKPSNDFIEFVEEQKEEFFMNYGVSQNILKNLDNDFIEPTLVDTTGNHIRIAFETMTDSDHLILCLSGAYRKLAKIYEEYFNEVVLVFVNGTNAKIVSI